MRHRKIVGSKAAFSVLQADCPASLAAATCQNGLDKWHLEHGRTSVDILFTTAGGVAISSKGVAISSKADVLVPGVQKNNYN